VIGRLLHRLRAGADRSPFSALATPPTLTVSSPSFTDGGPIPRVHAGKGVGDNASPGLQWSGVPAGAAQLVLVMDDIDVPFPRPLIHTVALVDPGRTVIEEGALVPGTAGLRFLPGTLRDVGYAGPRPIPGHGPHHYRFLVFALDTTVPQAVTTSKELLAAMAGHILAAGILTGTYER
jgi:Raf kinase inhibitor-like YbhB/YbcL family protein